MDKLFYSRSNIEEKYGMRKIGLILQTEPKDGGQHQYAVTIVECLLEKLNVDYELVAFCGNHFWRKWCREKKIKCLESPFPDISEMGKQFNYFNPFFAQIYYTYMTYTGEQIRREKIEIMFSTRQGSFIPNYRVKIISPVHDLMHRYEPKFPEVKKDFKNRELYMKCIAKYTDCVLVDSTLGKRQFNESYIKKISRKPYIVSLPFITPEYINGKEEYIEVPSKYVFYPAQFWKHKNHINLIRAIKIVSEEIRSIQLILVGSEKNNYSEIKNYIAKYKLENNITILGFVKDGNMIYLYKHAIGMIMPSYFGPTNIPPLEAMALGCPVAVSNKYAMREQIGDAGLLFNPDSPEEIANCIKRLWTDEKLREKMICLGYKKIAKWTKYEFGNRLHKIINTI